MFLADGLGMLRDSQLTPATAWRSDYDRYREIYEIACEHSKRLRAQLTKVAQDGASSTAVANVRRGIARNRSEQQP
jgi:hypothetical protein